MKELLQTLSAVSAPAGAELPLRTLLLEKLPDAVADAHGSVILHRAGTGAPLIFAAALDTPCLYVTYTDDSAYVRFSAVGDQKFADGTAVTFANGAVGVVGSDSAGQWIYTGTPQTVAVSDWAAPLPSFHMLGEAHAAGFALGQRSTVAVLLDAALRTCTRDVWFVFAAKTTLRQCAPTCMRNLGDDATLISVDVSAANDFPAEKTVFAALGNGTMLRVCDKGMLSAPSAIAMIEKMPFPTVREVSELRGVGGVLHKAYGGFQSVGLGIPVHGVGTLCETVAMADLRSTADLLHALCNTDASISAT